MTNEAENQGDRRSSGSTNDEEFSIEAYRQNFETFRSLNTLFWQIPLIAMTLTGGLWFGVSRADAVPLFRTGLLALAGFGNIGLIIVLHRLRHIMGCYLDWLKSAHPPGHVPADSAGLLSRSQTVKRVFTTLLAVAAIFSFILLLGSFYKAA